MENKKWLKPPSSNILKWICEMLMWKYHQEFNKYLTYLSELLMWKHVNFNSGASILERHYNILQLSNFLSPMVLVQYCNSMIKLHQTTPLGNPSTLFSSLSTCQDQPEVSNHGQGGWQGGQAGGDREGQPRAICKKESQQTWAHLGVNNVWHDFWLRNRWITMDNWLIEMTLYKYLCTYIY